MATRRRRATLGDLLQEHLHREGLSLRGFTRDLGVRADRASMPRPSHSQVSRIASGRSGASEEMLRLLADALGVRVEAFPEYRLLRLRDLLNPARNERATDDFLDLEELALRHGDRSTAAAALLFELNKRARG